MLNALLLAFTAIISWFDFKYHRIPNLILLLFVVCLIPFRQQISIFIAIASSFSLLLFVLVSNLGMGDFKLLVVQIWFLGESFFSYLYLETLIASLAAILIYRYARRLRGPVPVGPAIMAAITLASLAI